MGRIARSRRAIIGGMLIIGVRHGVLTIDRMRLIQVSIQFCAILICWSRQNGVGTVEEEFDLLFMGSRISVELRSLVRTVPREWRLNQGAAEDAYISSHSRKRTKVLPLRQVKG